MATVWQSGVVKTGEIVTKDHINELIAVLNNIETGCQCNCNYGCTCQCNYACTCVCNYCTCQCNHGCTCNCNYSDKRVKHNIIYI